MATTGIGDAPSQEQGTKGSQASGIGQTLRDATCQKLTDQKTRATATLAGAVRGSRPDGGRHGAERCFARSRFR